MIIERTYTVATNNGVHRFTTSLTEREFLNTLDGVYGIGNYKILEIF